MTEFEQQYIDLKNENVALRNLLEQKKTISKAFIASNINLRSVLDCKNKELNTYQLFVMNMEYYLSNFKENFFKSGNDGYPMKFLVEKFYDDIKFYVDCLKNFKF